jgi:hypothetical protein
MTRATRREWAERVRRWRASGEPARLFAEREGFNAGTLRWWSSKLDRPKFVDATSLLVASASSLDLEIGRVRVRVTHGFDAELLRAVVAALETR